MINRKPFYGSLFTSMEIIESDEIDLITTDCEKTITINSKALDKLSIPITLYHLMKNTLHKGYFHGEAHANVHKNDRDLMEYACQFVCNESILSEFKDQRIFNIITYSQFIKCLKNNRPLPVTEMKVNILYDKSLSKKTSHEILKKIKADLPPKPILPKNIGISLSMSDTLKQTELSTMHDVSNAVNFAENQLRGNVPGNLLRQFTLKSKPKIRWQDKLNEFLTRQFQMDYTWRVPSRSYLGVFKNTYLPSMRPTISSGNIAILIDTSGSIGEKSLNEMINEVYWIISKCPIDTCTLMCHDSKNHTVEKLKKTDLLNFKPTIKGGGGSDTTESFKIIYEHQGSCQENERYDAIA